MTDADPERLLAEALRAQAARAPQAEAAAPPVAAFGLLSGSDLGPRPVEATARIEERPVRARWVLAVALLLGLAAGAVVGLLTLV